MVLWDAGYSAAFLGPCKFMWIVFAFLTLRLLSMSCYKPKYLLFHLRTLFALIYIIHCCHSLNLCGWGEVFLLYSKCDVYSLSLSLLAHLQEKTTHMILVSNSQREWGLATSSDCRRDVGKKNPTIIKLISFVCRCRKHGRVSRVFVGRETAKCLPKLKADFSRRMSLHSQNDIPSLTFSLYFMYDLKWDLVTAVLQLQWSYLWCT